ncbi:hypothetical protein LG293_16425 (plasmid) [Citricoccus nitrophenolicus]
MTTQTATAAENRNRQPKGVSTGGQFATELRPESSASLTANAVRAKVKPRSRSELVNVLPALNYNLDDEQVLAQWVEAAQQASRFYSEHYGTGRRSNVNNADDVAQETMADVWKHYEQFKAGDKAAPDYPRNYLVSIAANKSVQATADGKRFDAENRRAGRELKTKLENIEKSEGRTPTRIEYDEAKAQVLAEWHDPKHKPTEDFDKTQQKAVSLDRPVGGDDSTTTLGSLLVGRTTVENDVAAASLMDHLFQDSESRGAKAVERRIRQAWNAVAEHTGKPQTIAGSLTQEQVEQHRAAVEDHPGGVSQAIRDYNQGELNPAVEALTAGFGNLKARAEQDVVDGLSEFTAGYPKEQANKMFASVLDSAGPEGAKDMGHFARETQKVLAGEDSATKRARKAAGIA